ncbi:hypothetical protein GCM10007301_38310 [Azorhizobium oxalatiphilum]|uniref:Uncharacterized protein n=1 Tax=Azorhizobium oxalatiphilum TaxID=980631 RepID=A0A917C7X1_9HYPH|nr:hypothetical protein GCM10007301_38310 [Azorhizobium oxalatiphilum]
MQAFYQGNYLLWVDRMRPESSPNTVSKFCFTANDALGHTMMVDAELFLKDGFQRMGKWTVPDVVQQSRGHQKAAIISTQAAVQRIRFRESGNAETVLKTIVPPTVWGASGSLP